MFLADKHNFGQHVEKVQRGADTWYRKPRTVFWEWLFFGISSPLRVLFKEEGENGNRSLADFFFNLEVEIESTWSGYVKEVESENRSLLIEDFYAFGALVAYSFVFGIRDLHKQNLVRTKTHFQPIDAEVVFTLLTLPHETLLLPFKMVGYEFAGIGALVESKEKLSRIHIEQILKGYWDVCSLIISKRTEIDQVLSEQHLSHVPMRVIIRNTSEYKSFLKERPSLALESEVEQIVRGDVPYYFKFLGDRRLFWLKTPNIPQPEDHVGIFQRDIDRHGQYDGKQWTQAGSTLQPLVHGALYLMKHFNFREGLKLSAEVEIFDQTFKYKNQIFRF